MTLYVVYVRACSTQYSVYSNRERDRALPAGLEEPELPEERAQVPHRLELAAGLLLGLRELVQRGA